MVAMNIYSVAADPGDNDEAISRMLVIAPWVVDPPQSGVG